MDTKEILKRTLNFIAEFRGQFDEMAGADEFLDDYATQLRQASDEAETLTPADQRQSLEKAAEVLKIISAELESQSVSGAHLRLAILQQLRADIRVAIRRSHRSGLKHLFDAGDENDLQRARTSNLI